MNISELNVAEIETAPPPLELSPEEVGELADELVAYHVEFTERYYRVEQAHSVYSEAESCRLPVSTKTNLKRVSGLLDN